MKSQLRRRSRNSVGARRVVLGVAVVSILGGVASGQPWLGSGDVNDPYQIWDANDMQAIGADASYWSAHFKLMADIDLGEYTGTSFNIIGTSYSSPQTFKGSFDGNGHTISNFTYDSNEKDFIGIFGYAEAEIKNLGLINPSVNAGNGEHVGSIVGRIGHGNLSNCYVQGGSVTGRSYVGGMIGRNGADIVNCYSTASVSGYSAVGGLLGGNHSQVCNSYSTGVVDGNDSVGGLAGYNSGGWITASYWDIETSGQASSDGGTGLTTAEMQTAETYFTWGCDPAWTIDEGVDYPHLIWEGKPGEIIENECYGGGNGTEAQPYLIYTAEHMNLIGAIGYHWGRHFRLIADIDLSDFNGLGGNPSFNTIGAFSGSFDGNDHAISNFTHSAVKSNAGLFIFLEGDNAEIKNLRLIDPNITGSWTVGSLVGYVEDGLISNCSAEGGSVSGTGYYIGGLVGRSEGTVSICHTSSDVGGHTYVGGLVGCNEGLVSDSYSTGSARGSNRRIGGLVGGNLNTIFSCYATGDVSGSSSVGGLVGENNTVISNCYSVGHVSGSGGGLVGRNEGGVTRNSYWDTETSGKSSSAGGEGKTTAEMQTASTFLGWGGADSVWRIDEGNDYPRFRWEGRPGTLLPGLEDSIAGDGTAGNPYEIYTAEDLYTVSLFCGEWGKQFKLMSDIDLTSYSEMECQTIGINECIPFKGVFDGGGYTVSDFACLSDNQEYVGLFGYVYGQDSQIRNVGITDAQILSTTTSDRSFGSVAGRLEEGTVSRCWADGGSVSVCGYNKGGGLVGKNAGEIRDCYSGVPVTITVSPGSCYVGTVGGLVGINEEVSGTILRCYSYGAVSGNVPVGGLVGRNDGGIVTDSFWDVNSSGQINSSGGTGLTTGEMQVSSTFIDAGWDFVGESANGTEDTWRLCSEGMEYPQLNVQFPSGDFVCPDGVTLLDFSVLGAAWRSESGDCNWYPICDISEPNDGIIDELDLMVFADNWLKDI